MIKLKVILVASIIFCVILFSACAPLPKKFNIALYNTNSGFAVIISEGGDCKFIYCHAKDDSFYDYIDDALSTFNTNDQISLAVCDYSINTSFCVSSLMHSYPIGTIYLPTPIAFDEHDSYVTLKRLTASKGASCKVVSVSEIISNNFTVRLFNPVDSQDTFSSALSFVVTFSNYSFGFLVGLEKHQMASATLINLALSNNDLTIQSTVNLNFLAFIPNGTPNENVLSVLTANSIYVSNYTELFLESIYQKLPLSTVYTNKTHEKLSLAVTENNLLSITTD